MILQKIALGIQKPEVSGFRMVEVVRSSNVLIFESHSKTGCILMSGCRIPTAFARESKILYLCKFCTIQKMSQNLAHACLAQQDCLRLRLVPILTQGLDFNPGLFSTEQRQRLKQTTDYQTSSATVKPITLEDKTK